MPPAIHNGESPFSRLLDPRWSELALSHLKETDEYLTNKTSVGKGTRSYKAAEEGPDAESKKKAKAKAKSKGQPAGSAAQDG